MKVKVTYFKQTGKFYASEVYETDLSENRLFALEDDFFEHVHKAGKAPGLSGNGHYFHKVLEPLCDKGVPRFVTASDVD